MKVADVHQILEDWAPGHLAEDFDNTGLLVGDPQQEVTGILVSLDCLEIVVEEAIDKGCNLIVCFHPILFKGLKKITGKSYVERIVIKALQNQVAIYALHTRLDNHRQGVNDRICAELGLGQRQILLPKKEELLKLVTYVPEQQAEQLKRSLYSPPEQVPLGVMKNAALAVKEKDNSNPLQKPIPIWANKVPSKR